MSINEFFYVMNDQMDINKQIMHNSKVLIFIICIQTYKMLKVQKKIMGNHLLTISIFLLLFFHPTQQSTLKSINKQCLCDITDQCDAQCCCDSSCDASMITKWQEYNLCLDDGFGIPFCSKLEQTDINILDLHSGLRTIYSVIKRLLCINSVNFVQPEDWYKKTVLENDLQTEVGAINIAQSRSVVNNYVMGETQFPISGLPLKGSNGLCRVSSQITKNNDKSSSCRVYIKDASAVSANPFLSVSNFLSALSNPSIQIFDQKTGSTGPLTSQSLTTSCASSTCQNVIRQVKIFINMNTGVIDGSSYVVVGPVIVDQAAYLNVNYEYSFVSVVNGQVLYPFSSKVGYQFGAKLNLLYKDANNQFYKIFSPLNLAFKKLNGQCRSSLTDPLSNQTANSFLELQFGQNLIISCLGTTNLLYDQLKSAFTHVGKYGASSNKLSEYVQVNLPASVVSGNQSVQLLIYYINLGVPQNPQYQISKVQVKPVIVKDGLSKLYVEFVSVDNKFKLSVPPAPMVDAYLPNDFLYPFFVA